MDDDQEARDAKRRRDASLEVFYTSGYHGHWVGAVLFAATLVGATMLWTCLPLAMAILRGGATGASDGRTATTFFVLYAAMAVGPLAGWALWAVRRRWAAMAVVVVFVACVTWLIPATNL